MSSFQEGPITAFLPCRSGSERVPLKNTRPFGEFREGLVGIKLNQLLSCTAIERIVLSTNDELILSMAHMLGAGDRLVVHRRCESLASSKTSTDALVAHAFDLIKPYGSNSHVLWTHVTSPFLTSTHYTEIITEYYKALTAGYDSLMGTTPVHTFLWSEAGPINYDRTIEKWPRTQTLEPVYEVNSSAFLSPLSTYAECHDRIGSRPWLHPINRLVAFDIDWIEDFIIAEQLLLKGLVAV